MMDDPAEASIGLLTDLHYDGTPETLDRLRGTIDELNRRAPDFTVFLGDGIVADNAIDALKWLRELAAVFQTLETPLYYLPGNHDLDHLSKEQFFDAVGRAGETANHSFVKNGATMIFLDANYSGDGIEYRCGNFDWTNAYIPADQLQWLENKLSGAIAPVVVFCHQRLDPSPRHSVTNAAQVRKVLEASGKVVAVFQGHMHAGDKQEIGGITYHTLPALRDGANPVIAEVERNGTVFFQ